MYTKQQTILCFYAKYVNIDDHSTFNVCVRTVHSGVLHAGLLSLLNVMSLAQNNRKTFYKLINL